MAKFGTLTDKFYATSLDTTKWDASNSGATIAYTTSGVEFNFRSATAANDYAMLQTDNTYDLAGSAIWIKVETTPTTETYYIDADIELYQDATHLLYMNYSDGGVVNVAYNKGNGLFGASLSYPSRTCWIKICPSPTNPTTYLRVYTYTLPTDDNSHDYVSIPWAESVSTWVFRLKISINAWQWATSPGTFKVSNLNTQPQKIVPTSIDSLAAVPTDAFFTRGPGVFVDSVESTSVVGDHTFMWDMIDQRVDTIGISSTVSEPSFLAFPPSATVYSEDAKPRTTYKDGMV